MARTNLQLELAEALSKLQLTDVDKAAVQLARTYAEALDEGADKVKLGPAYLAVLESLGMTPRARAAQSAKGGAPSGPIADPLAALRAQRAQRASRAN